VGGDAGEPVVVQSSRPTRTRRSRLHARDACHACSSFSCCPDEPRKMRGLPIRSPSPESRRRIPRGFTAPGTARSLRLRGRPRVRRKADRLAATGPRYPIRATLSERYASTARDPRHKLGVRVIASPISRMSTSVGDGWWESSRRSPQTAPRASSSWVRQKVE